MYLYTFFDNFNPIIVGLVSIPVVTLTFAYIFKYQVPALKVISELKAITSNLKNINIEQHPSDALSQLNSMFSANPFRHLWKEYGDSLHRIIANDGSISIPRATVPAELYFTKDALVDTPINADFFRHLPGIMTGIGIIGTFSGLVWGLHKFHPSDPTASLPLLLKEVMSAFCGSGLAIFAAIMITIFEKVTINRCYQLVEAFQNQIDGLFVTGAGEEYLARLVTSSEIISVHTATLKDALIDDLKTILDNLADKHIASQSDQGQNLADQISQAIKSSLEEPFKELGNVVKAASGNQGEAVTGMLDTLLTAFMAKLDDTFGQQISSITTAIEKSSESITVVQDAMTRLIGEISNAGQSAATEMSKKLEETMETAAQAQVLMNVQMKKFVEDLRELMGHHQNESKLALDESMQLVLTQLKDAIASIATERNEQIIHDRNRTEKLTTDTKDLYHGLSENVSQFLEDIKNVTIKMEENISVLQRSSVAAINGMNDGALVMKEAAEKFTTAGSAVGNILEKSGLLTDQMVKSANNLQNSSNSINQAFEQYDKTRLSIQDYVITLQSLIENAKNESGITSQMINDLEKIMISFQETEKLTTEHLNTINRALKSSFESFGGEMVNQVRNVSVETDKHLSSSLGNLQATVESMAAAVNSMRESA